MYCGSVVGGGEYLLRYSRDNFTFLNLKSEFSFIWHEESHKSKLSRTNVRLSPSREKTGQDRSEVDPRMWVDKSIPLLWPGAPTSIQLITGVWKSRRGGLGPTSTRSGEVFIPSVSFPTKLALLLTA